MRTLIVILVTLLLAPLAQASKKPCADYLSHDMRKLHSTEQINICNAFKGKALLIVNTASRCGFTPQFSGLETLHQTYGDRGLAVLGVPSNDFRQAAPDEETAARVCYIDYGVTFTMLSQQKVRGPDAHPVFKELGQRAGEPSWNFNKYLIDRKGEVIERFDSSVEPMSDRLRKAIESVL